MTYRTAGTDTCHPQEELNGPARAAAAAGLADCSDATINMPAAPVDLAL